MGKTELAWLAWLGLAWGRGLRLRLELELVGGGREGGGHTEFRMLWLVVDFIEVQKPT